MKSVKSLVLFIQRYPRLSAFCMCGLYSLLAVGFFEAVANLLIWTGHISQVKPWMFHMEPAFTVVTGVVCLVYYTLDRRLGTARKPINRQNMT